jgi:putative transposase
VVLWRWRYKLSLRDGAELCLERGLVFTHATVRDWEARFAPLIADHLRKKRYAQAGRSWYVDETYLKVQGTWCDLARAIDHDGNLVDARLSEKRDRDAATRFFRRAIELVGPTPDQVPTDGHTSYPRAIRETIGSNILHRMNTYLNNRLEQDHRGIQQRYYPMRGFGCFEAAARFCCAFDELRNYLRPRPTMGEPISLPEQRRVFLQRLVALKALIQAAS